MPAPRSEASDNGAAARLRIFPEVQVLIKQRPRSCLATTAPAGWSVGCGWARQGQGLRLLYKVSGLVTQVHRCSNPAWCPAVGELGPAVTSSLHASCWGPCCCSSPVGGPCSAPPVSGSRCPLKAPLRGCPGPCLSNSAEADWPQDGGSWEASPCSRCPALATAQLARPVRVGRRRGPELARKDSGLQGARVSRGHADTSTRAGASEPHWAHSTGAQL